MATTEVFSIVLAALTFEAAYYRINCCHCRRDNKKEIANLLS